MLNPAEKKITTIALVLMSSAGISSWPSVTETFFPNRSEPNRTKTINNNPAFCLSISFPPNDAAKEAAKLAPPMLSAKNNANKMIRKVMLSLLS